MLFTHHIYCNIEIERILLLWLGPNLLKVLNSQVSFYLILILEKCYFIVIYSNIIKNILSNI